MNEIIYLDTDEEITGVIDRLRKAKSNSLALVIPRGANLAQSIVNLKLLKKSAKELGKELSLVSSDRISRNLAAQIGMAVFSKVSEAEKTSPKAMLAKIADEKIDEDSDFKVNSYYDKEDSASEISDTDSTEKEQEEPEEEPEDEEESKIFTSRKIAKHEDRKERGEKAPERKAEHHLDKLPGKPKFSKAKKILAGIVAGTLIILIGVAYFFLPYADTKITLATDSLSLEKPVLVDKKATSIDQDGLTVPGKTIEVTKEIAKTYPTTGVKTEGIDKAGGKITVYNAWDNNPVTIDAGTKFTASGGKIFDAVNSVVVPGVTTVAGRNVPGSNDLSILAESAGEEYNIGASSFSISGITSEKQNYIYGRTSTAMTGGTTKTTKIVADKDITDAENNLKSAILEAAKPDLASTAEKENLNYFEARINVEVLAKESSKNSGEEAENFDYRLKAKVSTLGYDVTHLKQLMTSLLEEDINNNAKMLINPEKTEVETVLIDDGSTSPDTLRFTATFAGKVGQKISPDEIKDKIKNKKYNEAKRIVENYDKVSKVDLSVWPTTLARVPLVKNRIKVTFDYSE